MKFSDRLIEDGVVIFLLHGVTRENSLKVRNYTGKHVYESDFIAIVDDLDNNGNALSMDDLIRYKEIGETLPPRSFCLTFDDGFENNYSVALPVLEERNIPGLIYITTSWTAVNGMSWTDRLEYCLESAPDGRVSLPWFEDKYSYSGSQSRRELMNIIRHNVKRDTRLNVGEFVDDFFIQCGSEPVYASEHPLDLKLDWKQIEEIDSHSLFTIGGHTHTHRIMSFLSEEECEEEIAACLGLLKDNSSVSTVHFSYPEGLRHTYNESVISQLKEHGILCSPSAEDGVNRELDLFNLKRVMIG